MYPQWVVSKVWRRCHLLHCVKYIYIYMFVYM